MFLLDTHVWIWAVEGDDRRLGPRTRRWLSAALPGTLLVSSVTVFELAALHTSGRLHLARPLDQWVRQALQAPGVRLTDLTLDAALDAGHVPKTMLADPIDRLLVATAREQEATVLTCDRAILDLAARSKSFGVHNAAR